MTFNPFDIVKTSLGEVSIRDNAGGEIIHNPVGPWKEARSLYVEQAGLSHRFTAPQSSPLVLYDVGLGAGFNAMAAMELYNSIEGKKRDFHIVSFESDLRLFDFKIENISHFPESLKYEKPLKDLRSQGFFSSGQFNWTLHGKFSLDDKLPLAEVIFFDPYSPKINPDMWTLETFKSLRQYLSKELPSCLITYSVATKIRTAMLVAGFYVGQGKTSGQKLETTFAASEISELQIPLGDRWFQRWTRSHDAIPLGDHGLDRENILKMLLKHPQFSNSTPPLQN